MPKTFRDPLELVSLRQLRYFNAAVEAGSFNEAARICSISQPALSEQIAAFPKSGRVVPEIDDPDLREVIEGPYRMIYRILRDGVDVVAILHSSRLSPLE